MTSLVQVVGGRWRVVSGRWSVVSSQLTTGSGVDFPVMKWKIEPQYFSLVGESPVSEPPGMNR